MKKILLLSVVAMLGLSTFAQTSFADIAMSNGNKYVIPASFTPAGNANIYVPVASYTSGTGPWWDLTSYAGVEVSLTCDPSDVGHYFQLRVVVPKADNTGVVNFIRDFTFNTATQSLIINLSEVEFTTNGKRVWAFKVANVGAAYGDVTLPVTINSINALSFLTSVPDMSIDNNKLVDVYDITGIVVRKGVVNSEATNGLPNGIYIVGNKKIYVRNK